MNQSLCWGVGHSDPWDHLSQRARVGGWNHRIDSLMMLRRSGYHKEICKLNHTSATKSQKDLFWQTRQEKSVTRTLLVLSSETALHEAIMSSDPWYMYHWTPCLFPVNEDYWPLNLAGEEKVGTAPLTPVPALTTTSSLSSYSSKVLGTHLFDPRSFLKWCKTSHWLGDTTVFVKNT